MARSEEVPSLWARVVVGAGLFAAMLAALGACGLALHYHSWTTRPLLDDGRVTVVVPKGTSWTGVVEVLADAQVVKYPRYFDFWGRREALPARVKAGAYTFEGPLDLQALAAKLSEGGRVAEVQVTIPEGFNIWGIAIKLDEAGLVDRRSFLAAATDSEALAAASLTADSFEGYLFPDTYRFAAGTTADKIVERMHQRFVEVWTELGKAEPTNSLNRHELVTLASIVEKETAAPAERGLIARVFHNRLALNMKLQTDPTCVYNEERWAAPPTPRDCKDPLNRYSTYVIKGLPPGPIANPGKASLMAVLTPADASENEGVLYFVARRDGTGTHQFSKTLEEHNSAVREFLK